MKSKDLGFKENDIFSMKKIVGPHSRIIRKSVFLIGQVPIEKCGLKSLFLLFQQIEKSLTEVLSLM